MDAPKIMVVEDEEAIAYAIGSLLEEQGCDVTKARSAEDGLAHLKAHPVDVALLDIVLPGMNGIQCLEKIKAQSPDTQVIMMTSHASVETAIAAIRNGAYDYLNKPFDSIDDVWVRVRRALEKRTLVIENRELLTKMEGLANELSASVFHLSSLVSAANVLSGILDLQDLLEAAVDLVVKDLGCNRASIMLVDTTDSSLTIQAHRGLDHFDTHSARVQMGVGIAGKVAETGEPMLVTDTADEHMPARPLEGDLGSSFMSAPIVMSVPLRLGPQVLGVVNVTNRASGESFDQDDLKYLQGLSGQIAIAVERVRRVQELGRANESLRAAQDREAAAERLKVLGQLAAGVAHDVNNALAAIMGRTEILLRSYAPNELPAEVRSELEVISSVSRQCATGIQRIQDFTRIRKDRPADSVELNEVVRDAVEIARPKWKTECEKAGLEMEVAMELGTVPMVLGNRYELAQVVSNLIYNAVEASPRGGRITVRTRPDDGRVMLEVSDTGDGMDAETQNRVFDPFFTTKASGQGLGLSVVFGIVSRHQGEISVSSEPGRGTTFHIRLPQAPDRVAAAPEVVEAAGPPLPMTVLVVDDESVVRITTEKTLRYRGHRVVTADSGAKAVEEFAKQAFDLVITDLGMPGMSGTELAKSLKRSRPEVPIILLSGWGMQQDDSAVREAQVDVVLSKPCSVDALLGAVDQFAQKRMAA